jgi:hypothetical protein
VVLNNEIFTFESRDVNDALKLRDRRKEDEIRPIYRLNPSYRSAVNQRVAVSGRGNSSPCRRS